MKAGVTMKRIMCIVMGLSFFVLGILGITELAPMLTNEHVYVNVGEIILGATGFFVGFYSRRDRENFRQRKETNYLRKENDDLKQENKDKLELDKEALKKDNEQLIRKNEQITIEYEQLMKECDQLRKENERLSN